jgi:hypothetical protein
MPERPQAASHPEVLWLCHDFYAEVLQSLGDCRCGGADVAQKLWVIDVRVVCRGDRQLSWRLESFQPLAHSDPA